MIPIHVMSMRIVVNHQPSKLSQPVTSGGNGVHQVLCLLVAQNELKLSYMKRKSSCGGSPSFTIANDKSIGTCTYQSNRTTIVFLRMRKALLAFGIRLKVSMLQTLLYSWSVLIPSLSSPLASLSILTYVVCILDPPASTPHLVDMRTKLLRSSKTHCLIFYFFMSANLISYVYMGNERSLGCKLLDIFTLILDVPLVFYV